MLQNMKIGFIGGGNMAEAIMAGLFGKKAVTASQVVVSEPQTERRKYLINKYGIESVADNRYVINQCDIVVLAVKPQSFTEVAEQIGAIGLRPLLVSILAGITTRKIESAFGEPVRVVRVMPNTPALVGEGMSGIAGGKNASLDDVHVTEFIFEQLGKVVLVEEQMIDLVTGVSGSGPAYVFYMIESMCEAAVRMGMQPQDALTLVVQTFVGSLKLLVESGENPAELRRKVTSKGGTTERGIRMFDENNFKAIMYKVVKAATDRSRELSNG